MRTMPLNLDVLEDRCTPADFGMQPGATFMRAALLPPTPTIVFAVPPGAVQFVVVSQTTATVRTDLFGCYDDSAEQPDNDLIGIRNPLPSIESQLPAPRDVQPESQAPAHNEGLDTSTNAAPASGERAVTCDLLEFDAAECGE